MTPTIQYSATFEKANPAKLYELFADSAKHSAATGMPAKISRKVGGDWTAFGKMLRGKNLVLIPNRMIVQTWRSSEWKKSDPDSILVVTFEKTKDGAKADLVHVGVPEYDHEGVTEGWIKYYWEPWKAYLSSKAAKKRS
ncbi:MAG TPA: SRPBCC domain-containing protein [Candidatus Acidoferrales bacterium]|jgi:activator of HSP90 ATPase|nr:SRPBCC domain-containing protein [Candidatus Acidoferrales bacterium]